MVGKKLDVVLIADESDSVSEQSYRFQMSFLKSFIVEMKKMYNDDVRIALVRFSDKVLLEFDLGESVCQDIKEFNKI